MPLHNKKASTPIITNYLVNTVSWEAKETKNRTTLSIQVLPPGHDRNMLAEERGNLP